jgi:HlyD family secretion protein
MNSGPAFSSIDKKFPTRFPMILGLIGLIILLGGFGTWAILAEISGAIVASGRIEVDRNRQIVQHPDGGVVAEILVDEGQTVNEGDTLIRLDPTILQSELAIIEGQMFELMARRGRLEAERDRKDTIVFDSRLTSRAEVDESVAELMQGQERLFLARSASVEKEVEQLGKRRIQISDQIQGIDAQLSALETQLGLIAEEKKSQEELLAKGLAQATRVLALQRAEAQLSGSRGELIAQRAQAEGRITELEIEILKLDTARREEAISRLRDQQYRSLEIEERHRAISEQLARLDIKAPVSGVIYGLSVFTPRSVIRPADPVMFLVPQDRPLIINAQVDPTNIDSVTFGQEVILRFPALDQRTTPELAGRVTQISADAFQDEATRMSYYRVEITLNDGETDKLPEGVSLIPGMPAESFIRTADRTPMAYLVKPLSDYFAKAFRG